MLVYQDRVRYCISRDFIDGSFVNSPIVSGQICLLSCSFLIYRFYSVSNHCSGVFVYSPFHSTFGIINEQTRRCKNFFFAFD